MPIPSVEKVENFDENLDSTEDFVNSTEETFTTHSGLTRQTITGVINSAVQRPIVPFDEGDPYPDDSVWVEQPPSGGQIYRPKPSALPIAAGPFDADDWVFVGGGRRNIVVVFESVAKLVDGASLDGVISLAGLADVNARVETVGYYGGWNVAAKAGGPIGGAAYNIFTAAEYSGTPDGSIDFYVGGGTDYVAKLMRDKRIVNAEEAGIVPDSSAYNVTNSTKIANALSVLSGGGKIKFNGNRYYFNDSIAIDDGHEIEGIGGVTYRDNQNGQTRLTFTSDVDGITYNGFNSFRNALRHIKIDNDRAVGTSTKTGINFTSNGGSTGTRGLANILDNITVQNFQIGVDTASPGDFAWFYEFSNLKIFRCETALIIDGSDGASSIDGLHIDAAGGFGTSTTGIEVRNSNGLTIRNYSVEQCTNGMVWDADDDNDRLYMHAGYFESNTNSDIKINGSAKGQLYSYGCRMAWFYPATKNQSILAASGADVKVRFYDLTIRGDQSGLDGLTRILDISSSSTRVWIEGLLIQAAVSEIWLDSGSGKCPVYIKMLNEDKNGNNFELYRDALVPSRMSAKTERVSSVAPTTNTFVIDTVAGGTIDLKYSGARVRGLTAGAFNEWIWNGSSFLSTP